MTVDVEASTAVGQAEVTAARTMIERVRERRDLWTARLAADTAYGLAGARDEFLLAATAQNLRKLAKLIPATAPAMA